MMRKKQLMFATLTSSKAVCDYVFKLWGQGTIQTSRGVIVTDESGQLRAGHYIFLPGGDQNQMLKSAMPMHHILPAPCV